MKNRSRIPMIALILIATLVLLDKTPKPARPTSLMAPLRALRHRGLLTMSITALLGRIRTTEARVP